MIDVNPMNSAPPSEAFASPFNWDATSQVGLPTLQDQVTITAASEFAFWQPTSPDWLTSLVEATINRLTA
jgi:hypothetical protein